MDRLPASVHVLETHLHSLMENVLQKKKKAGNVTILNLETMTAKQFAKWAMDAKSPAPFVQALYDLLDIVG